MKVLYISYVDINAKGGAIIEARKFYYALKSCCEAIENFDFKVISVNGNNLPENFEGVTLEYKKIYSVLSRLMGHSYYMYMFWLLNRRKIMNCKPDVVILGRSNLGFIAYDIKKKYPKVKVITDVDNIEIDYIDAFSQINSSWYRKITNKQFKNAAFFDEKRSIVYSDYLIFLTERNLKRANELYGYTGNNYCIIPICQAEAKEKLKPNANRVVVFYGNLNYEANHSAMMWFVENVWKAEFLNNNNVLLIIAGKAPRDELREKIEKFNNIKLYANYGKLSDFVPAGALSIVPLQKGAGMKTKVAEALSLGMIIASSDEGLVGYEECKDCQGIWRTNTATEYIKAIEYYLNMTAKDILEYSRKNVELFEKYYSQERANKEFVNIFEMIK